MQEITVQSKSAYKYFIGFVIFFSTQVKKKLITLAILMLSFLILFHSHLINYSLVIQVQLLLHTLSFMKMHMHYYKWKSC